MLSVIGIVCLTIFPFRFDFGAPQSGNPFFLGPSLKHSGYRGFLLNVLLFVPFGFGLSALLRKRGVGTGRALVLVLASGAITSYTVEFLQLYIPSRDSGWEDIFSNTTGAVVGFLLLDRWGELLLKPISIWEEKIEAWLSLRRACIFLLVYLGVCFALSVPLQRETRLSNWDTTPLMFVGSDGTGRHAWKGQIAKLQLWNRSLPDESARKLTAGESVPGMGNGLLASYEFTGATPYGDHQKSLPALALISSSPPQGPNVLDLDGSSWLSTKVPVTDLTQELKRTNQFAVRIVCTPANVADLEQFLISISQMYQASNLFLRRDQADLVFWFRSPLSANRSSLGWRVRDVFSPGEPRDILVSYDGSNVSLYVNGKKEPRVFSLSPGAALVHKLSRANAFELEGYLILYDLSIFLPAGMLLGMIARQKTSQKKMGRFLLVLGLLLPAVLYEFILTWTSGRAIYLWEIILCISLIFLGSWLINADRSDGVLLRVP